MKILRIIDLGYVSGGAEAGVVEINKVLEKNGHIVKVLSSDINMNATDRFSDYEFKTISSKNPLKTIFRLFNPYSYFKLKNILNEYNPDIVHLHTMEHVSPSVLFLLKKYPAIMTIHGPEGFIKNLALWTLLPEHFKNNEFNKKYLTVMGRVHYFYHTYIQRAIYKLGFKNIDLFVGISNFITSVSKNELQPIVTIHNFVRLLKFKNLGNKNNLLFLGRVEKVKGIEYLIAALPKIIEKFPDAKLTIVGEGGYSNKMINLTKILNLEKSVIFIKKINHNEVEKFYHDTSVLIMPSIWPEAFGRVGIEAMSAGRPVIATNIGGIPEWLDDGKTGYLVEDKNSQQIAKKVISLFSNKKLLNQMGINARKKAEEFRIEKHSIEIENIYKTIITKYQYRKIANLKHFSLIKV
jgi:glycosyltransferase involved in cell wall biosynthesis